jgi:hypothetical protein
LSTRLEKSEFTASVGRQLDFVSPLDRALQVITSDMVEWLARDSKLEPWAARLLVGYQRQYDTVTVAGPVALRIPGKPLERRK